MQTIERMIAANPRKSTAKGGLVDCIAACVECAEACILCADACLAEEQVAALRRCIRLNRDCADICAVSASVLSRLVDADAGVLRAQLEACAVICASCEAECSKHAQRHEHCKICAEICRRCEQQCRKALGMFQAAAA